ncbi:hypothetical protein V5799_017231 [Amblyomma americanum]|uniref:Secreted protein n=1 Tax=Amblyomma americanum TaxID=6943 RepID=A0AAQ4F2P7_AMBAM
MQTILVWFVAILALTISQCSATVHSPPVLKVHPAQCEYNATVHENGKELDQSEPCLQLKCVNGQWRVELCPYNSEDDPNCGKIKGPFPMCCYCS